MAVLETKQESYSYQSNKVIDISEFIINSEKKLTPSLTKSQMEEAFKLFSPDRTYEENVKRMERKKKLQRQKDNAACNILAAIMCTLFFVLIIPTFVAIIKSGILYYRVLCISIAITIAIGTILAYEFIRSRIMNKR